MVIKIKNKLISLVCALVISAVILSNGIIFACAEQTTKQVEVSTPQCMLVLGDSISTGYGLTNYKEGNNYNTDSYANLLAKKYKLSQNSDYYNYAIDGQTSLELYSRVKSGNYDEDIKKSDLILISIGGNDLLSALLEFIQDTMATDLTADEALSASHETADFTNREADISFDFTDPDILNNLNKMVKTISNNITKLKGNLIGITDEIHEISPNAEVVFQTVYNPLDGLKMEIPSLLTDVFVSRIEEVNRIITMNAETDDNQTRYDVADVYTSFSGKSAELTNIGETDIHPNSKGHEKISECIDSIVCEKTFYANVTVNEDIPKTTSTPSKAAQSPLFVPVVIMIILIFVIVAVALIVTLRKRKIINKRRY